MIITSDAFIYEKDNRQNQGRKQDLLDVMEAIANGKSMLDLVRETDRNEYWN